MPGPGGDACAPCESGPIEVPVGTQTTLAIELQNTSPVDSVVVDAAVEAVTPNNANVILLAPVPERVIAGGAVELFVGVTMTATTPVAATVAITTDAGNQTAASGANGAYPITLHLVGVDD